MRRGPGPRVHAEDFVLRAERVVLRPASERHIAALQEIVADPDVVKTLLGDVSKPEFVEAEARKWIDEAESWQEKRYGCWGIFDRAGAFGETDGLLGIAAADKALSDVSDGLEIFYFLARRCWGKGVAFEAAARMGRYLFDDLQVPTLEAAIFAEVNPGSVRIVEKLGMRPAGRVSLRHHGLDDDRLRALAAFDLWRVRTAPPVSLNETLAEAAHRAGQILAEGCGSLEVSRADLRDALASRALADRNRQRVLTDSIDQQLAAGMAAKGMALYRVYRDDFPG